MASSVPDVVKWLAAAALLAAGLVGFYYFAEHSTLFRIIGLLVAIVDRARPAGLVEERTLTIALDAAERAKPPAVAGGTGSG